ncbi:MAG: hypothetical protein SGARI_008037, partial [Bacillariaceae sp.]
MWDDWEESFRLELKAKSQKDEKFLQDQIKAVLDKDQQDYEKGLESLYDVVDGLDILSEADLNLSLIKDEEDDWSLPASSLC